MGHSLWLMCLRDYFWLEFFNNCFLPSLWYLTNGAINKFMAQTYSCRLYILLLTNIGKNAQEPLFQTKRNRINLFYEFCIDLSRQLIYKALEGSQKGLTSWDPIWKNEGVRGKFTSRSFSDKIISSYFSHFEKSVGNTGERQKYFKFGFENRKF